VNRFNRGLREEDLGRLGDAFNRHFAGRRTPRDQTIPTLTLNVAGAVTLFLTASLTHSLLHLKAIFATQPSSEWSVICATNLIEAAVREPF
jgi:hypothetical protein